MGKNKYPKDKPSAVLVAEWNGKMTANCVSAAHFAMMRKEQGGYGGVQWNGENKL